MDERFVPGSSRITEIESMHRYLLAAQFCNDMTVLDAASGDGYGSSILAAKAKQVTGVDIDPETVKTAGIKYPALNLSFIQADCTKLPFDDNSFDRVVSFETIEHLHGQEAFLSEIRRVLKPDGLLIISSPNKTPFDRRNSCENGENFYHVRELEQEEFLRLLKEYFPHVRNCQQDAFYSSVISGSGEMQYLARSKKGDVIWQKDLQQSQFSFALASAGELPDVQGTVFVDACWEGEYGYVPDDEAVVNQFGLRGQFIRASEEISELQKRCKAFEQECKELQAKSEYLFGERAALNTALLQKTGECQLLESRCTQLQDLQEIQKKIQEKIEVENNTLLRKNTSLTDENSTLRQQTAALTGENSTLRQQTVSLTGEINRKEEEKAFVVQEKENLEQANAALQKELEDTQKKAEYLYGEYLNLQKSWALRIFGRFALRQKTALLWFKISPMIHRCVKGLILHLPGVQRYKMSLKNFLYGHFGFLFRNVTGYQDWKNRNLLMESLHLDSGDNGLIVPDDLPLTSIVIPAYNNLELTERCIESIFRIGSKSPFEVIVADDGSTQDFSVLEKCFPGIRLVRSPENRGFLMTANMGAEQARGEYLLFLNNDTEVLADHLDELTVALYHHPEAGMIGSQMIYQHNGLLQESGNLICRDGKMLPLGRDKSPDDPEFTYFREVDFCSAASCIMRKKLFDQVGGFDTLYFPAYFEDPDLALKFQRLGFRNYVMPLSKVLHKEMASYGERLNTRGDENRKKFNDRWLDYLADHALYDTPEDFETERKYPRERIFYLDAEVPMADRGSGGMDGIFFMEYMLKRGYDVVFHGEYTPGYVPKYTSILLRMGVECVYAPQRLSWTYLEKYGHTFSWIFVSRIYQARCFDRLFKQYCPRARYIFDTVDVHFVREELEAAIENDPALVKRAAVTKKYELAAVRQADATIVISSDEKRLLEQEYGMERVYHIPQARAVAGRACGFEGRSGAVFIGSAHQPNVDGLCYFHDEILPLLPRDFKLIIIGEALRNVICGNSEYERVAKCPRFRFVGFVAELGDWLNTALLTVAPLRYGAGTKGKVASSMSYGVPCVSSAFGVEGTGMIHGENVLFAADASAFAEEIKKLMTDPDLWLRISDGGLAFLHENYAPESVEAKMDILMQDVRDYADKTPADKRWSTVEAFPKQEEVPDELL